jgi:hypothetical protein
MFLIRFTTNLALALLASAAYVNSRPSLSKRDASTRDVSTNNLVTLPVNRLSNLRVLDEFSIPAQLVCCQVHLKGGHFVPLICVSLESPAEYQSWIKASGTNDRTRGT